MMVDSRLSVRFAFGTGIVVITLIALLITVMFLRQDALVSSARAWVLHSYEVVENIEALSNRIKDAVLYQRNFMISGDPVFLNNYNKLVHGMQDVPDDGTIASGSIDGDFRNLEALISDNLTQKKNLSTLRATTAELVAYMDETIALQQQNLPDARSAANAVRGKDILDRLRSGTATMLAAETQLLKERTDIDNANSRRNTELVLIAIAFFYIIKLSLSGMIFKQWRAAKTLEGLHHARALEVTAANEKLRVVNQDLEALNKQIRESGQVQLRAIVDHAVDGLITINKRGEVESFNPACEKIFGYKAEEVMGRNIKMLMPEPYHSEHDGYLEHYRDTREARIIGTSGREVSGKRKDGSIFPMDLSVSAFTLEGEEHFSGIIRDITLRKEAETELLRYMKELEHSNQELDDFAYIASHDLKEPLRGLFNHASFLLEDYKEKLDNEGMRRLNRLAQLAQRMEHLVNDLLYFSRLGRSDLAIQTIDPNQIISEIGQMMDSFLKDHHARITVPTPMPCMTCDKPRITEVFRNLITNAVKYNDKPERLVEVGFLNAANAPHGVEKNVFYVKDNGIGIEPEFHQEIFRIFKRLNKNQGDEGGTGVGLTFVKKIVERHKGHIWLESKPEEGTTFYFNLNQEKAA